MKLLGVGTHIKVKDIDRSRQFYDSLGFKTMFAYGSEEFRETFKDTETAPEAYSGVVYDVAGSSFEIADGHVGIKNQDVFDMSIKDEKLSAMIRVDSLVDLFDNDLLDIVFPVRKYNWGTIEVALRDPDGYVLVFIAPYSEQEHENVSRHRDIEEVTNE